jgi:hypothetical protein
VANLGGDEAAVAAAVDDGQVQGEGDGAPFRPRLDVDPPLPPPSYGA